MLVLCLFHLLATLLLFMLHNPVEVVQHVGISRLESKILLNFDLKFLQIIDKVLQNTYIFRVVAKASTIRWVNFKVDRKEFGNIHDSISNLMQLHGEVGLEERRKDFVIVIDNLGVKRSHWGLATLGICSWCHELAVLGKFSGSRRRNRWVHRKLNSHLIVVGEHGHRTLISNDQVDEGSDELPRSELMCFVINCNGIKVRDECAIPVIGMKSELAEG